MLLRMHANQNGMILVLAMFMLALLSMIGIASMMTSTTDIEIASGERQYVESFYRGQAAHTIAGDVLLRVREARGFSGEKSVDASGNEIFTTYDTYDPDGNQVYFDEIEDFTFAFRVLDPDCFAREEPDSVLGPSGKRVWRVDQQTEDELPCPAGMSADDCAELNADIGSEGFADADLWTDIQLIGLQDDEQVVVADIDIDQVGSVQMAGFGAEWGSRDLGMGSNSSNLIYNIDTRARLKTGEFNHSPSRQAIGMRVIF